MDRVAIEELFAFADHGWHVYEGVIRPLGDEGLRRPAPGSGWPSLSDALSHIVWAYVRWLQDPSGTSAQPQTRLGSWDELEAYRNRILGHARVYLNSLGDEELVSPREMNVDGDLLAYSPADIFAHAFLHDRQHHGDLNTLLYQLGVQPPIVEYRFSLPERQV